MSGSMILFGIIFLAGGFFQFYARDWLWQSQVRANEIRGIGSSERTETWDNWRSMIGMIGIVGGIIWLSLGLLSAISTPGSSKPQGTYFCAPDVPFDPPGATTTYLLKIDADGKGTIDNVPLTWTYTAGKLTFSGDGVPATGKFETLFGHEILAVGNFHGKNLKCTPG